MRKKLAISFATALTLLALVISPVGAITYGTPDGNALPYVGIIVMYGDEAATQPLWRCSGTLLTPTVFLTAGHCVGSDGVDTPVRVQVWFDAVAPAGAYPFTGGVLGEPVPHPNYANFAGFPNTHDVGLVILDTPVTNKGYGRLPTAGLLDGMATQRGTQNVTFMAVGYGVNEIKPNSISLRTRYQAVSKLINLRNSLTDGFNLMTTNNPGNWGKDPDTKSGGTCFGDSGGPIFLNGTNIVVAVTSFGITENCKGNDYAYRTDISATRTFLANFVAVP
jgi:hypothetical protein